MLEVFLTEEHKKFRQEVQDLVKSVPRQLILDMDADKIEFPHEFVREAGRRNTPDPTMFPTTSAVAINRPNFRASGAGILFMCPNGRPKPRERNGATARLGRGGRLPRAGRLPYPSFTIPGLRSLSPRIGTVVDAPVWGLYRYR